SARSRALRENSVSVWGFRAPIGAFLAAWGGVTMIVSAPWDDWWHSAYGLDVKIISPPHVLLILGMLGVEAGVLLLVLGERNRAEGERRAPLTRLALYVGGLVVVQLLVFLMEYIDRSAMHQSFFYRDVALVIPLALATLSRATSHRWAATAAVAVYSALALLLLWILPLFPAEPKLGPVFHEVTHLVPFEFPLLLVFPALLLDLLFEKKSGWGDWKLAAVAGIVFVASFLAVQWPFGDFLQSPAARNAFFGAHYMGYYTQPTWRYARFLFDPAEAAPVFARGMALAVAFAILSTRLGLAAGGFLRRVTR
ncbi:MAG TPA: hypothetical protein VGR00_07480, partial [Thermoanaerobaculia bacterium]|nr:hypothetical protein [Thermoanaerobaculia bacterium]